MTRTIQAEHAWVANDGRGGPPRFKYGDYPDGAFDHLQTMPARCKRCGVAGWFTPRTWRSTQKMGPGPCPKG